jgi:hypothetical protein
MCCVRLIDGYILVFRRFHVVANARISFVMSARFSGYISAASTEQITVKFDIWDFYKNMSRKFQIYLKIGRNI